MKLGINLASGMPFGLDRSFLFDWARSADEAGFEVLAVLDRPNYDSWEPIVTLAATAVVTERIRLATAIIQLPTREEVLLAKQAAVVDRLSSGRLIFGVAGGGREDDYAVLGRSIATHRKGLRRQVEHIREIWAEARSATEENGPVGPAPFQDPGPPIWVGATAPEQMLRVIEYGDAFIFGAGDTPASIRDKIPQLRAKAESLGKRDFTFSGICHVGVGDPDQAFEIAARELKRYSRNPNLNLSALITCGSTDVIAKRVQEYADVGLDLLILSVNVRSLDQIDALARDVLPDYR
jgi:alkanesulfonate monooxygenase SsuD/methylene tetrahydromethanopterin reductase-like flavin-dependent oxidoreductase (luciferase family)